jgi:Tol biopolymer transport system component
MQSRYLLLLTMAAAAFDTGRPKLSEVLYVDSGRLCSIAPVGGKPNCARSEAEYDWADWRPGFALIVAEPSAEGSGPAGLQLLDSTGRRIRGLEKSVGMMRPVWSPDGRTIFALDYDLASAIARWDADGRHKTLLPVSGGEDSLGRKFQMISFSPSGRMAALTTMHFAEMGIAQVASTGLQVVATLPRDFRYVSQSVWLDEGHLLFLGKRGPGVGELWELTVSDGTVRRRGIDHVFLRDQIAISPDRRSIVVTAVSDSTKQWRVWRYDLETGKSVELTHGDEQMVRSWGH